MSTEGNKAENKVEFGLRNAHYAPVTIDETANKMTWNTGKNTGSCNADTECKR